MTDWPEPALATPTHIQMFSRFAGGNLNRAVPALGGPNAQNWTANTIIYVPFALPFPYPLNRVFWMNGSTITTTNVDCGVYTEKGTKLAACGSTAMTLASSLQNAAVTVPTLLNAGSYYWAWMCDQASLRAASVLVPTADGQLMGLLVEARGALGLPATMTPIAYNGVGLEFGGITRLTTSAF